tara:strand:- start:767437 stop:767571 length:135 start_codon:yes stop_codon:yes gene_type:complete
MIKNEIIEENIEFTFEVSKILWRFFQLQMYEKKMTYANLLTTVL